MAEETMGTMGTEGTINITSEMMQKAKDAITAYQDIISTAYSDLTQTVDGIKESFTGAAGNGYRTFYETQIKTMFEKESGTLDKHLAVLTDICDSALSQLPGDNGIDEELAKVNNQNQDGGQNVAPTN